MKKRVLYSLLFGIPGFFVAGITSVVLFGALAGVLWLFIFGDNPWPDSMQKILPVLLVLTFLIVWVAFIGIGYYTGKRLENDPILNKSHVLISAVLTAACILFIILQQWSVGNIGPKSDTTLCSDYCSAQGYSGSGMPPLNSGDRTCSCYDSSGKEALKIPLEKLKPGPSK
jgi:hypothetical protein